jgi:hypothetical protein
VLGIVVLALAAGAVIIATSGGGDSSSGSTTSTTGATATTGSTQAATKCTSQSGRCAFITGITLDKSTATYVASYTVKGFTPIIYTQGVKGSPSDHHVHFFYDTVGADHAGSNTPAPGKWAVWDKDSGHGEFVFNQFNAFNQNSNGGFGAKQLCILVADANHGVEQGSGNCAPLPKIG